ncbi:hypothetical protein [Thiomicrorhabdus sp.]|uniref:hypothetical protein n=1 Tax=Thiomicrorhabdus sp. TaxID=2039724 RepID=UPI002AA76233|nr:hypothetical protein [Thiomicrorhabdus sp.]
MTTLATKKTQCGFGLLQVAILLMIIGGLASYMLKPLAPQASTQANEAALKKADKLLNDFIVKNGRLPCVDVNGDGVEDCSSTNVKGGLPYITLGMPTSGFVAGDSPIKYGVYRKANNTAVKNGGLDRLDTTDANAVSLLKNDADLASLKNRYQPTMAGGYSFNFTGINNQNSLDFCQALNVGEAAALDTTKLYVQTVSGARKNVAYALSMGGRFDGNGNGGLDDGLNGSSATAFNSSGTLLSSSYDDYVISRSFSELKQSMQCDVVMQSLNMMANSVLIEKEVKDQAQDMADAAVEGAIMAGVNVAVIAYSVVLAAVDVTNASVTLGVASGLLSGAIASCAVLVGCAFIPVYTASVVAAGIGVGLGVVAVGAGAAAGISQAVATGLYADIAIRANAAIPPDVADTTSNPDYSATITALNAEKTAAINEATTARSDANTKLSVASTTLSIANQRFTDMYNDASIVSARNGGALPNTYATEQAYTDAVNNLKTKSEAYKTAVNDEYAKLQDYQDKAAIAAGLEEDCNNTSCVIPQSAFDGLTATDPPPSCPAGGTPNQSSTACQNYATAQATANTADSVYQAAKIATNNAYTVAYQAALDHPVYIPEVKDTDGKLVSAATTKRCEDYSGCDFTAALLSAAGNIIDYHAFVPVDENDAFTVTSGSYIDAILIKQSLADSADNYATEKESNLTSLQNNIDSLQCMQDGNYWDKTTLVCSTTPAAGVSTAISVSNGGTNILQKADSQGVFR